MSDIVNDLREGRGLTEANGRRDAWVHETMQRAAAEIERLRDWHRVADERSAEIVRLSTRLAEAERDAARYRWLRERMEVGPQRAMSGSTRDAISVRIGCSFMDSEVSKRRSLNDPDAHENGCKKFDAAIDAYLSREKP